MIFRTKLPCTMVNRDQVSIWSILKNCIGKDLSKITMPVVFNEPLTMIQRACESIQYSRYIQLANESDDPIERMEYICAFIIAGLSANCERIMKPFNPLLYETYEIEHDLDGSGKVRAVAQQVSHHPPISAAHNESDHFVYSGSINPKIKFWGRSVDVQPDGQVSIILKRHNEKYTFKSVSCTVHNVIVGKLWFEHHGPLEVINHTNGVRAQFEFKRAGWFGKDLHRFDGFISTYGKDNKSNKINETNNKGKRVRFIYGKWSDYIKTVDITDYNRYMQENPNKLFRIPDRPNEEMSLMSTNNLLSKFKSASIATNSIPNNNQQQQQSSDLSCSSDTYPTESGGVGLPKGESMESLDIPNSRILWRRSSDYQRDYYNFTQFTMRLNELSDDIAPTLPLSDSRFRPDVRSFEAGDLDQAGKWGARQLKSISSLCNKQQA